MLWTFWLCASSYAEAGLSFDANVSPRYINSMKSPLSKKNTSIVSKLNNVGASLGMNEKDIPILANALKHLEYDRLKVTPHVSSMFYASQTSGGASI
jgi:hypothetical protein